ncbi:MAG TPA: hypothetical protein V6D08_09985 [Candidatus Obscuribacterales bacterium]
MKNIKLAVMLLAAMFCSTGIFAGSTIAADKSEKQVITDKGKKGAERPKEIKERSAVNPKATRTPPPSKGGPKTRGVCGIELSNWTNERIDIYIDGYYEGTLMPWADAGVISFSGPTSIYGESATGSWGPRLFNCPGGGVFTWKLTW